MRPLRGYSPKYGLHWSDKLVAALLPLVFFVVLAVGAAGCNQETSTTAGTSLVPKSEKKTSSTEMWRFVGKTMGTTYSVVTWPAATMTKVEQAALHEKIALRIEQTLERVNDDMSTWRKNSDLSKFNAHPSSSAYLARKSTAKVVQRALDIAMLTDGAFDVTLGPLIRLWGFDRDGRRSKPPTNDEVKEAKKHVGWKQLRVDGQRLYKTHPAVEVNLSGIAKGYGADKIRDLLQAENMRGGLVEIGGELASFGDKRNGEAWRVGISRPDAKASTTDASHALKLQNQALATSGDYRNFFESDKVRYSHIIDAATGKPVHHDLVSASIVAPDCMTADGLATAMLVLGEVKGRALVEEMPHVEAMFIRQTKTGFMVSQTAGFPETTSFLK